MLAFGRTLIYVVEIEIEIEIINPTHFTTSLHCPKIVSAP